MSKVWENHLEMKELAQDNSWQEWQEEQERLAREEAYGFDNMEEPKAKEFARRILEK